MKALPRTVVALGVVSLLTDMSSEMIYPLLPVFVAATLGGGAVSIGLIEGIAEATASVVKLVSGALSDRMARRKWLLLVGYGLAGGVRPLIGLARAWPVVLFIRFADRVGKGLRGPPRDAIIADAVDPGARGRAFGLHRAMDHAGAVLGPLVAFALIGLGLESRQIFFVSAVPAAAVIVVLLVAVREPPRTVGPGPRPRLRLVDLGGLGGEFRRLLLALVTFALASSTDAFLLYRMSEAGIGTGGLALVWSLHHVVKVAAAYLAGAASDRWGRRRALLAASWIGYAAVYALFAAISSPAALVAVFMVYGVFIAAPEAVEKAWVVDLVPAERRGAAFGWMQAGVGIAALPASLLFGVIWWAAGPAAAFLTGSALAILAALLVTRVGQGG
ncbi:MAG TPA: MFS transporter [Kofleriaceae bacterium]|nr:MFS transporter [Kofleriaceae bacterium]